MFAQGIYYWLHIFSERERERERERKKEREREREREAKSEVACVQDVPSSFFFFYPTMHESKL